MTITPSREEELRKASASAKQTPPAGKADYRLGLYVKDLTPELAREFGVSQSSGVVVVAVRPGSSAESAGLHKRDIILEVNRETVGNVESYGRAIRAGNGKSLLLLVKRDDATIFVPVKPAG